MSATAPNDKHIGLLLDVHSRDGPRLMTGLSRWMRAHPGWKVSVFVGDQAQLTRVLSQWRGDGLICVPSSNRFCEAEETPQIPLVSLGGISPSHSPISVNSDQAACGQLAAEHFADRGFQHYRFISSSESQFNDPLATEFLAHGREADSTTGQFAAPLGSEPALADWLRDQPLPLAILASSDHRAAAILQACRLASLNVPDDVAVLGVGNEIDLCELCTPTLSSVDCDLEAAGFETAALLSRLISGEPPPDEPVRIPPAGIVTRRSSEAYAFDDPDLCSALRFIHEHAHESIKVKDVLAATNISRRSLENRFRRYFSRSLHDEIWRVHFERAQDLLTTTDLGLQEVAELSGFRTASALANLFKQKTGLTPRRYRAEHRR